MTSARLGDMVAWAFDQDAGLALAIMVNGYRWMVRQSLQTTLRSHARAMNIGMLELGQELENQRLILQALTLLSLAEGENAQPNLDRLTQLRDQAEGFPQIKALAEGLAGYTYWEREAYQPAGDHYAWAANHFHQAVESIGEGRMLLAIARLQIAAGQYGQAEKLLFHALPLLSTSGGEVSELAIRLELGDLNIIVGKYGAALYHFDSVIERGQAWLDTHPLDSKAINMTLRVVFGSPTLDVLLLHGSLADHIIDALTLHRLIEQAVNQKQNITSVSSN